MTPTLRGRWTARLLLTGTAGLLVTLPFCLLGGPVPLVVLLVALGVGLALDVWYDRRQISRWDHDWPVHRQLKDGLLEAALTALVLLPGCCGGALALTPAAPAVVALLFPFHFGAVWLTLFLVQQGPLRIFFPYARFRGGRLF